jgi:hypothetical protein
VPATADRYIGIDAPVLEVGQVDIGLVARGGEEPHGTVADVGLHLVHEVG